MKLLLQRGAILVSTLVASAAMAAPPHEHGVARLDVAVEPGRVTLMLEMPLDTLVGFERAPRNDAERAAARTALARLADAAKLWRPDPAAGCGPAQVDIEGGPLEPGHQHGNDHDHAHGEEGHADADASYTLECAAAERAGFVDTGLLESFPRLRIVHVQVATPKGQWKAMLSRPATQLKLVR
ncbi:ZrgA family zinc uptake protein [Rubrivivax gelatinosus]|uniref:Uncharacterized protein DUF2796 n=1 Tax=Rubrivivax gelatinosus TaxID=28068 RepID=A0A4R2MJS9_RUBGE|nr:DUF2796 domain-containing protein [Rubrivivax gelatinosus]MBK1686737.1 hypothetical protein [Rubrivivax gelatinosus]TCP05237.1 uncharacterized protein DUF2796 [Rubrivivax gelatinosus]